MDKLNKDYLEKAILSLLEDYLVFLGGDANNDVQIIIDENRKHYLLIEIGWHKNQRIYGTLIHINIINDKIWIQQDGTEEGVANELVKQGIPHEKIVLGFKTPERRKITDFAVS